MTQDQDNSEQTTQETKKTRKTSTPRKTVKRAAPMPEDGASAAVTAETMGNPASASVETPAVAPVETPAAAPVEAPKKITRRRAVKAVEASSSADPVKTAGQAGGTPVSSSAADGEADTVAPAKPKTPRRPRAASKKAATAEAGEADASAEAASAAAPDRKSVV